VLRFLARRLAYAVPVVFGVCLTVFITTKLIPGSAVDALLGPGATADQRAALVHSLGLDRSIPVQFLTWLEHVLRGDFGTSISRQQPVLGLITSAFGYTLILTAGASVVAFGGGAILGTLGAVRPKSIFGRLSGAASTAAISAPQICVALALIVGLAIYGPFPTGGIHNTGQVGFGDLMWHLVLPALAAGIPPMGVAAQLFRTELSSVLASPLIESLRARGFTPRRVLVHALHNTVPGILTIFGLQFAYLIGGVVLVEVIFSWPGSGNLIVQAISSRDVPVIEAGVLLSATALVVVNLCVDVLRMLIDRRVR